MVTFTIKNGQIVVGSPVGATVDPTGSATTNFTLPAAFAIGTYTIQAEYTDTGNFFGSSDATHSLTVTQPMPAKLAIFAQPSSGTAGKPFAPSLVIYEEDQFGNLEVGDNSAVITASLATGTGPLLGTLTASVVGGIATFSNLYDDVAENITLKFSSGNLAPATSTSIVISPDVASKLVVTQQPAPLATAGAPFSTQPVVKEADQYGNVITTDSAHTVTASRGATGTASLQGASLTVTLSSGEAVFSGLSYNKAETMNIGFTTMRQRCELRCLGQRCRQPSGGKPALDQPAAIFDGDRRAGIRHAADHLRGRPVQ